MRTWLIDDRGDLCDAQSPRLRTKLGGFSLGKDFAEYCVRNLGFVLVAPAHGDAVKITLRPRVAAPMALAGLVYWLTDKRPSRVVLAHFDRVWRHELVGSSAAAGQRIIALTAQAQDQGSAAYHSERLDHAHVPPENPLAALLRQHNAAIGMTLEAATTFGLNALGGRYLVAEEGSEDRRLVLQAVGPGLDREARFWLERAVGTRLEDAADIAYGRWIADATRDVLRANKARLDAVDVSIRWPLGEARRYQFQRLLLPISLGGARRGVLSATVKDATINLRDAVGAECF